MFSRQTAQLARRTAQKTARSSTINLRLGDARPTTLLAVRPFTYGCGLGEMQGARCKMQDLMTLQAPSPRPLLGVSTSTQCLDHQLLRDPIKSSKPEHLNLVVNFFEIGATAIILVQLVASQRSQQPA